MVLALSEAGRLPGANAIVASIAIDARSNADSLRRSRALGTFPSRMRDTARDPVVPPRW